RSLGECPLCPAHRIVADFPLKARSSVNRHLPAFHARPCEAPGYLLLPQRNLEQTTDRAD
ncbi:hypothetical protein, partial [uncultured Mameliella sp.]|uniref:hypothetical protein n=1 Tax=uncultured Mameliella sp. TaxID=1447087 RepID=UPI002623C889